MQGPVKETPLRVDRNVFGWFRQRREVHHPRKLATPMGAQLLTCGFLHLLF